MGLLSDYKRSEGVSKKHSARSLARYLGMSIRVNKNDSYDNPVLSGNYTLTSVCVDDPYYDVGIDNPGMYPLADKEVHAKDCFPILKTVDQLSDKEILDIDGVESIDDVANDFSIIGDYHTCYFFSADIKQGNQLLKLSAGAVPDKDSPTGYVSVHDSLPCFKKE